MTKEDFIKKHRRGNIMLVHDFESDLEELLRETAEAQKAAVLNQFAKDWKWAEIHPKAVECVNNTPLVTSPNTGDKK